MIMEMVTVDSSFYRELVAYFVLCRAIIRGAGWGQD